MARVLFLCSLASDQDDVDNSKPFPTSQAEGGCVARPRQAGRWAGVFRKCHLREI